MHTFHRAIIGLAILTAGLALGVPCPEASQDHFVIVNDGDWTTNGWTTNYGTILQLTGSRQNPTLTKVASLNTGVESFGGGSLPGVQVISIGGQTCIFLQNTTAYVPNEISSFKYPGLELVGNYSNSGIAGYSESVFSLVASGSYLFAFYGGDWYPAYLAVWQIDSGCALKLLTTYQVSEFPISMAATPNGKTLVMALEDYAFDSYSIGPNGALTELGPFYEPMLDEEQIDITADSQYVVAAGATGCTPQLYLYCGVNTFMIAINADGSLGTVSSFENYDSGVGTPVAYSVRLSPDEQFLYALGYDLSGAPVVYPLTFSENPPSMTAACHRATFNALSDVLYPTITTALPSGAGGAIYIAEPQAVGVLAVNSSNGCLAEVPSSPFTLSDPLADANSLISWPPRPF